MRKQTNPVLQVQEILGQENEGFDEMPTFPAVWTPVSMPLRCLHESWLPHDKENNLGMQLALSLLESCPTVFHSPVKTTLEIPSYKFRKQVVLLALQQPTAARCLCPSACCSRYLQKELKTLAGGCYSGHEQFPLQDFWRRWDDCAPGDTERQVEKETQPSLHQQADHNPTNPDSFNSPDWRS